MSAAIEAVRLRKAFGRAVAVRDVSLRVEPGTVYGVLGPNGAGKTTTIKMLTTLLRPDSGSVTIHGHDVVREADTVRGFIGVTGQHASVDGDLTGLENLVLAARLRGRSFAESRTHAMAVLEAIGLDDVAGRQVRHWSGGMRRRLDIAASLITAPRVLFLDEPTTGLDPSSRENVWGVVRALAGQGTTVVLTTQYLEEADRLADRIAVIDRGLVVAEGAPGELKRSLGARPLQVALDDPAQLDRALTAVRRATGRGADASDDNAGLVVPAADVAQAAEVLAVLAAAGVVVAGFEMGRPSLDEVFLALTARADTAEEVTA